METPMTKWESEKSNVSKRENKKTGAGLGLNFSGFRCEFHNVKNENLACHLVSPCFEFVRVLNWKQNIHRLSEFRPFSELEPSLRPPLCQLSTSESSIWIYSDFKIWIFLELFTIHFQCIHTRCLSLRWSGRCSPKKQGKICSLLIGTNKPVVVVT